MTEEQVAVVQVGKRIPGGQGLSAVLLRRASEVELDWDVRQKSRIEATDSHGRRLHVFLARGTLLRGGDILVGQDGSLIRVKAAPQPVLVVTHCAAHGTPFDLLRAAYHLGNRHVPLELQPDRLLLEPDHVLAGMLRGRHLIVTEAQSAFEPEGGAYGAGGDGHSHGHGDRHEQGQRQSDKDDTNSAAPTSPAAAHVHGPACAHGHRHGDEHGDRHGDRAELDNEDELGRQQPVHGHEQGHAARPLAAQEKPAAGRRAIGIAVVAQTSHVHGPGCDHDHDHSHAAAHGHPPGPHGH